jgi:amino acid adenylation domain-containing protein
MGKQEENISKMSAEEKRELLKRLLEKKRTDVSPEPEKTGFLSYPLSAEQKGLWAIYRIAPDNYAYNVPCAYQIRGAVHIKALKNAFEHLSLRHPCLRTRIRAENEQPLQVIEQKAHFFFETQNISHLPESDINAYLKFKVREPFDLEKGPLMRVHLFSFSDTEHILLFILHHIIFDGTALAILLNEVNRFYEAELRGIPLSLPPLKTSYADFVDWQTNMLLSEEGRKHEIYWHQKLSGELPVLNLPLDRPRPRVQTYKGEVHTTEIPPHLANQIKALAQENEVYVYSALLSAYAVLLYRYTRQENILIGSPVAGRPRTEFEDLLGYFVNMVVIRSAVSGDLTFRKLLRQIQTTVLEAMGHGDYPFTKLAAELGDLQDRSVSPLFQTAFVFQSWIKDIDQKILKRSEEDARSRMVLEPLLNIHQEGEFDLTLEIMEYEDRYLSFFKYNPDLFDHETVVRMSEHFRILLEGIISDPDRRISKLPLLTDTEKHKLLVEWNDTQAEYTRDKCMHRLFEAQAEKNPKSVAVTYEDEKLTYGELNERANQVAHYLRGMGVGPDVLVGIYMERSPDVIVGLLGVLKAGGAYVPLDPVYPQERLSIMIEDSQMPVLLTQERLAANLPDHHTRVIRIDADWEAISQESKQNPESGVTPENLIYVIYTSGSTGKPKGVLINHYNVVRLFTATQSWYNFDENDVWTLFHSYAFDFSVWEIWGALIYGGRLVVVPYLISRSFEAFYDLLHREQVTVLNQTPTAFRQLIQVEEFLDVPKELALRLVIFGGEALELQSLRPWFLRHGDQRPQLVNMYGITETTVHVTYRPLTIADLEGQPGSMVGRPIPDLQVYVLDQNRQPAPFGVHARCSSEDTVLQGATSTVRN